MTRRVISLSLSPESALRAQVAVAELAGSTGARADAAALRAAEAAAEYARGYLASALPVAVAGDWTSGELAGSIRAEGLSGAARVVVSNPHAAFVEFGTGYRGMRSPYPGDAGWAYDTGGHGEGGWYFPDPTWGSATWTQGLPAVAFMWETAEWLRRGGILAMSEGGAL